jgi:hypothetical protein
MENTSALPAAAGAPESGQLENGRLWLNTASVVDRIVRDFTADALRVLGHADVEAQLDFRCRAMNTLFLGGPVPTDRYERGPWNTPEQLGQSILTALRIEGETRLAVRDAFMVYLSAVLDGVDPDQFDAAALEPYVANLRNALLGLPDSSPYWTVLE